MKLRKMIPTALILSFLLGIHDGNIALWRLGHPCPLRVFPYSAAVLPPEDQALLARGITIDDLQALTQLLEDYLS